MSEEQLIHIGEDLEYIRLKCVNLNNIEKYELRHISAILRRLIIEDIYGKAWRSVGFSKQPKMIAPNIDEIYLRYKEEENPVIFCHGGGLNSRCAALAKGKRKIKIPKRVISYKFTLSEFKKSSSVIADHEKASREDIVKYGANIGGGVHSGASGRKAEQLLVDKINRLEKKILDYRNNGIYTAIFAIAQSVSHSPDANLLVKKIAKEVK